MKTAIVSLYDDMEDDDDLDEWE